MHIYNILSILVDVTFTLDLLHAPCLLFAHDLAHTPTAKRYPNQKSSDLIKKAAH